MATIQVRNIPLEIHQVYRRRAAESGMSLPVDSYPLAPVEERVWELRDQLSAYDAWYVALAERLDTELVTSDLRLRNARSLRCAVVTP